MNKGIAQIYNIESITLNLSQFGDWMVLYMLCQNLEPMVWGELIEELHLLIKVQQQICRTTFTHPGRVVDLKNYIYSSRQSSRYVELHLLIQVEQQICRTIFTHPGRVVDLQNYIYSSRQSNRSIELHLLIQVEQQICRTTFTHPGRLVDLQNYI